MIDVNMMRQSSHGKRPIPATRRGITSADIAARLGISKAAVSYAFNPAKHDQISLDTRQRILELARELNYVPNSIARSLKHRRSRAIGVVFPDMLADWAHRVLQGLSDVLDGPRYTPLISLDYWDQARQRDELLSMLARQVEGVIVVAPAAENADVYREFTARNIPMLFLGDAMRIAQHEYSYVVWDEARAVTRAIEHLLDLGRRRIWFVHPDTRRDAALLLTARRANAFAKAMRSAGLPVADDELAQGFPPDDFASAMRERFGRRRGEFDAIFAINDILGRYALEALDDLGISVPQQVAVASICDHPISGSPRIGLTSVHQPLRQMGREAAEVMLQLIADPAAGPIHRVVAGDRLVVRGSTVAGAKAPWTED